MLDLLQSNLALVIGSIAVVVLIAARAFSTDRILRSDLRGAVSLFFAFIVFRVITRLLHDQLPPALHRGLTVLWMLTFAFGVVRASVSVGLYVVRLRSGKPTAKILRDVLDFGLYAFTSLPILKSQLDIDLSSLLATSALLSLVLGLALQDTLGNLFAGLAIQLERPFHVGDTVKIGAYTGQVVQIGWRATRIQTFRNESITLPNSILSKESVQNFTRGDGPVGVDLTIDISYETPPNLVKATVLDVLLEIPLVLHDPAPKCRPIAYAESGITFQIRYFVSDFLCQMDVKEELLSRLWYRFRRDGISTAFPHRTVQMIREERKPVVTEGSLVELLQSVDLFRGLPREVHQQLAHEVPAKQFGKNERIIEAGEAGNTFYLVASGELSVRAGRGETEVNRLKRGSYFGEMSLLTGEPRSATVVALTDSVVLELDRATFSRLFADYPNLAKQLSALLAQRRTQLKAVSDVPGQRGGPGPRRGADLLPAAAHLRPRRLAPRIESPADSELAHVRRPVAQASSSAHFAQFSGDRPRRADAAHPVVAEREVELHRVVGVDPAERGRDLLRGPPGEIVPLRQPEVPRDPPDVGVERDHQGRAGHPGPDPEVDAVGAAHHPAQEQVEPLRRAGPERRREQVVQPALLPGVAPHLGERDVAEGAR